MRGFYTGEWKMKWMTALIVMTSVGLGTALIDRALAAEEGPKHTIAEVMKNAHKDKLLNKGQEVVVEGRLVNNSYETKDGEKRYGTTVEINEFLLLAPKQDEK